MVTYRLTQEVVTVSVFTAQAAMVQINWQSSDREAAATATSSSDGQTQSKISGGAIAGIVIGCIVGIALIVAGIIILIRKRRRRTMRDQQQLAGKERTQDPKKISHNRAELGGGYLQPAEADSNPVFYELTESTAVHEAP